MMAEGAVLWKCGACDDCFYDIQVLASHKCIGSTTSITLSESCIKQLEEQSYSSSDIANTTEQVEQAITAIAALEEDVADYDNDASQNVTYTSPSLKRQRKPKPTIISVGSNYDDKKFPKRHKGKRSLVWTYFHALDCKKAMCCVCQKVIAYCGTPTNLVYHLSRFHPAESEVIKNKQTGSAKYQYLESKLPKISVASLKAQNQSLVKSTNIITVSTGAKKTIADKLVEFLVLDLQPVTILQGEGFQKLIHSFEPSCKVPDPKKVLKDFIPKRYYTEFKKVKNFVSNSDKIHISVELWTGYNDGAFITITSHFVTDDYVTKCYTLNTSFVGKTQTPQNIATALLSCISDWNINSNSMCIVSDGSDNIVRALNKQAGWKQITCLAHTLNKIIKESFSASPEITRLIEKCRSLVLYLKHNDLARQKLMEIQTQDKQMQIILREHLEFSDSKTPNCPLKAKKDVPSHWITMFHMLQRIFTLRNIISMVLDYVPSTSHTFSDNEWLAIEETISLLKAFEVVTLELCSERFPLLSKVIPVVQGLLSLVNNCTGLTLNSVERVRKDLLTQLRNNLGQVEHNVMLAKATLLDPRFKNIAFQSESAVDAAVLAIAEDGAKYQKCHSLMEQQSMEKNLSSYTDSLWECFDKKATPKKETLQSDDIVVNEVKLFFEEPLIDRKKNPILWWRDHGSCRYPILAKIAKQMLSIPATSMPPERVFLQKGQVFSEKRKFIKPKYIDQFLFLNGNVE